MDASCKIQRSIHDVRLTYKYVSRILGTYHFLRTGRLFLCLVIALRTYGITKSKASNTQADDGYKKIRRKHTQALHSQDFCKQISM